MTELDDIRAEIVWRRDSAQEIIKRAAGERDLAAAELLAHDRAVALFNSAGSAASPATLRRDIVALVLASLDDEPKTVEAIALEISGRPSQVRGALVRLGDQVSETSSGWRRP